MPCIHTCMDILVWMHAFSWLNTGALAIRLRHTHASRPAPLNPYHSPRPSPSTALCHRPHTGTSQCLSALPHRLTWGSCGRSANAGRQICRRSLDKALCSSCCTFTPPPEPQQARTQRKVWECCAWDRPFLVRHKKHPCVHIRHAPAFSCLVCIYANMCVFVHAFIHVCAQYHL